MRHPTDRSTPPPTRLRVLLVCALLVFAVALIGSLSPASAAPSGRDGADAVADAVVEHARTWTLGGLAFGVPTLRPGELRISDSRLSDLNSKTRVGGFLLPGAESLATIRPWIGPGLGDGRVSIGGGGITGGGVTGGILIDVPLGSFVFTPSFGASLGPANRSRAQRDAGISTEFRSQLELGYVFDNKSRFTLGYSRIATDGNGAESAVAPNNVFGFYYRLPFGGP
ncbi:hypothetical protein [Azospirillum griseum]|uniref:Lipid A 3-O-deacylase (PagL) n=1 Tax=Azospirillum griseum TaxID=2496639 RepID=A0A3S0KX34_9PROT|nr:hypothetical protein [Azospirillum griseum]RTR18388.1 hypothetical protein EJ903_16195 [Azospirillum griseum]